MTKKNCTSKKGEIIQINEENVKEHLGEIVRGTVQETLNALLDEEADRLCNAKRYERSEARKDTRAGYYARALHTKAGEVELKVTEIKDTAV
jgi:putative transposase